MYVSGLLSFPSLSLSLLLSANPSPHRCHSPHLPFFFFFIHCCCCCLPPTLHRYFIFCCCFTRLFFIPLCVCVYPRFSCLLLLLLQYTKAMCIMTHEAASRLLEREHNIRHYWDVIILMKDQLQRRDYGPPSTQNKSVRVREKRTSKTGE